MRILLAALTIAVAAGVAHAQDAGSTGGRGKGRHQTTNQQKADPQKQKALDEAYKAGVSRIPDPKEKYDPWKNTR